MSDKKKLYRSDWLGIILFAFGSTGAVLMLLAMSTSGAVEAQGPFGPIAAAWKYSLGLFPSLFLNAAIAFLGARLFLEVGKATLVRNLLGCAGLAIALAVICGAWKIDAGGYVGQRTGAVVSEHTHVAVGTLIGLISFFAVAWFAWFRSTAVRETSEFETGTPVAAVIEKSAHKGAGRPAVHKTTAANEGVSLAESAALFPEDDEPVVVKKLTPDEIARAALAPFSSQEIPPSPYPEDVRKKGQIPAGARPIENSNVPTRAQSSVSPSSVYRWTAAREDRAGDGPGTNLVEPAAAPERAAEKRPVEEVDRAQSPFGLGAVEELADREEAPELSAIDARPPVTAAWERTPAAFQPEAGDEEPVDAYGTPLTLVEKLRQARREGGIERANALPVVEGGALEADVHETKVPRELDADIVTPIAINHASFEALEAQTIDETDLVEFEETELEETVLVADDEQGETFDGDLDPVDDSDELEPDEALDIDAELSEEELEPVAPPSASVVAASRPAKLLEVQPSLFDGVAETKPARAVRETESKPARAEREPEAKPVRAEREVVLLPVAAAEPQARETKDHPVEIDARTKLLQEIGCLFIERGRVAVSMLQRQYEMDFDDACKVLDDLQEMGLIGPYLGGQRRDILLTREQWLERVSQLAGSR